MKKKILSLLLIVSLMMAFTVTSFANAEKTDEFNLSGYSLSRTVFESSELSSNDDRITFNVTIDQAFPKYSIRIYDKTTNVKIFDESFKWDLKDYVVKNLNSSHSYSVWIKNESSSRITGTMKMKFW